MLSLATGEGGDSEDWRDVDGLFDNIMLQESRNCGKSRYAHTCIVEFQLEANKVCPVSVRVE